MGGRWCVGRVRLSWVKGRAGTFCQHPSAGAQAGTGTLKARGRHIWQPRLQALSRRSLTLYSIPLPLQVYLRQGKLLLAVQAAKKAQQLAGAADPSVHSMAARLAAAVLAAAAAPAAEAGAEGNGNGSGSALPAVALEVAQQEAAQLLGVPELTAAAAEAYRQQWAAAHAGSSLRHAAAAAEVAPPEARGAAIKQLQQVGPAGVSHSDCVAVAELLAGPLAAPEAASVWQQQCAVSFPWSAVFGGASVLEVPAPWEEDAAAEGKGAEAAEANGLTQKAAALALS